MSWPMHPISELCELAVDCVNKTAPTVDYETDYKMIRTTNVKNGFIDLSEVRYVTEEVYKKWTRRSKPQYGDVILTREAPVGEVGRFTSSDDKVFLGQRLFHYRPNPKKLDWNFLAYVLQSPLVQGRFKGMGFGATVDHVRVGDAENLPIPCPPLEIQKKIGNTLSAYDDLIENNRRRIQLLEQAARLLYREWFVHLRFPGHEHVTITDGVPEGWETGKVGENATLIRGKSYRSSELVESDGKPFVNLKCVARHGGFRLDGLKRFSGPHRDDQVVVPGDIVIAVTDMTRERHIVAHPARVPAAMGEEAVFSMDMVKLIPNETVDSSWFYYFLRFSSFSKEVREHATGTNVLHLKPKQITDYVSVFPPRLFQEQFGETSRVILDQQDNLIIQNERLSKARDLLLPRLMNGEVAV